VSFRRPSELYSNDAHPELVENIRSVVAGTTQQIMSPTKVYSLTFSSSVTDTPQLLGIETVGGKQQIRTVSTNKKMVVDRNLYSVVFQYLASFSLALVDDPTDLVARWSSIIAPDINNMLQIHGIAVATDYLTNMVMHISRCLYAPTYEGGKLIMVDFHRDPEALRLAIHRVALARADPVSNPKGERRVDRGDRGRGDRVAKDKPAAGAGPAPVIPLADRPKPYARPGTGPPTFAVTKAIRESPCANNSKGFPCAFAPCPYDHSK
jgi:hypothetical protein